jgi:hypothetical protein
VHVGVVPSDPPWYFSPKQPDGKNMAKKRVVLEIGMGTRIRAADPTKAACRALRDALWHNSLSIATALGQPLDAMIFDATSAWRAERFWLRTGRQAWRGALALNLPAYCM